VTNATYNRNNHPSAENKRGEWYPAIPIPFYMFLGRCQCNCGKIFWSEKRYHAHYALHHIVLGDLPL